MTTCPTPGQLVDDAINRLATQYRESPRLIHLIRTYVAQVEEAAILACGLPSFFDIETAVGDQLTIIGKRMGWPRCHCVCDTQPVFGFECAGFPSTVPIASLCDENATFADCGISGFAEICLADDEMYRATLLARRYQMQALYDLGSLTAAVRHLYGDQAIIHGSGNGRIVIAPGRPLTNAELAVIQIVPRVLPVAPGIKIRFHFGPLRVFGFGEGFGGLCEPFAPDGLSLATENGLVLVTEDGEEITTGPLTRSAPLLCEFDPAPYDCITR
jgi:hypothetical protein